MLELEAEWTLTGAPDGWWRERSFLTAFLTSVSDAGLDLPFRLYGPLVGDQIEFDDLEALGEHEDAPGLLDEDDVFLATDEWALDGSWIQLSVDQEAGALSLKACLHPDSAGHLASSAWGLLRDLVARLAARLPGTAEGGILDLSGALAVPASTSTPTPGGPSPMRDFDSPQPLPDGLSWTAKYDSFNQRYQEVYFGITLWRGNQAIDRFMVVVDEYLGEWDGKDRRYDAALARDAYRGRLARAAAAGESNCEHGTGRFHGKR